MARSGENLGSENRKQFKNTCTSVTGIVDEVYTEIATHNKWGLKFCRPRDFENVTDLSLTNFDSSNIHASRMCSRLKSSSPDLGRVCSFLKNRNLETWLQLIGAKTKSSRDSVKSISWFRHCCSFPLFHGFHISVDFTGNRSDPRFNFLHTQHREIATICLF